MQYTLVVVFCIVRQHASFRTDRMTSSRMEIFRKKGTYSIFRKSKNCSRQQKLRQSTHERENTSLLVWHGGCAGLLGYTEQVQAIHLIDSLWVTWQVLLQNIHHCSSHHYRLQSCSLEKEWKAWGWTSSRETDVSDFRKWRNYSKIIEDKNSNKNPSNGHLYSSNY